jgi:2-polyprenyl-3-methyl-5-hydroxy-6-metoxy-1,4-benzoquinol methylase
MVERLSLTDNSLFSSYAEDIQRHEFALDHVRGKRLLDAGCGTGFGSHFLAANGAKEVVAMDVSEDAMNEAKTHYKRDNLRYECQDIERLGSELGQFDVVTNFGSLPHLRHPEAFIDGAASLLVTGGKLIMTMPNGEVYPVDETGKPLYKYQFRTFGADNLIALLSPRFRDTTIYGQWRTHAGYLRKLRARDLFEQLSETYHNPMNRIGRAINRLRGKAVKQAPVYTGEADSFPGDYVIYPLSCRQFPWPAESLIVVARL